MRLVRVSLTLAVRLCWRALKKSHFRAAKMSHSALEERAARRLSRGTPWTDRRAGSRARRCSPERGEAMHAVSKRVLFRALLKGGMSKAATSRDLGISRRTATRWAAADDVGRGSEALTYGPRAAVPSVLNPYDRADPVVGVSGFVGGTFVPGVAGVGLPRGVRRGEAVCARGSPAAWEAVGGSVRDGAGSPGSGGLRGVSAAVGEAVCAAGGVGFSRLLWFQFYERQTMEVLVRDLEPAFGYFGGVPWELLFDQLKAAISEDRRASAGELPRNAEFTRFSRHCPHRARTKGQASDCASEGRWGGKWGDGRRSESLRPWCLAGGSSPGLW